MNEVCHAARAYLRAAEVVYVHQSKKSEKWLFIPEWFVVYHLCFISIELFMKSLLVTIRYSLGDNKDGPCIEGIEHAYNGHSIKLDKLSPSDVDALRQFLTDTQWALLCSITNGDNAKIELTRGRYPYETKEKNNGFPRGDDGRKLAKSWLDLARSISEFCA